MKRKFLSILLTLAMALTLLPTAAMAEEETVEAPVAETEYVAQIGGVKYDTLAAAVAAVAAVASTADKTITLLDNLKDTGKIELPEGVTLDGQNHQISGNSCVAVNAGGGTVQNVAFKDIHNNETLTNAEKNQYGTQNKTGKLTALYGSGLTGKLEVTGCTFENVDWDAIQITPKANADKANAEIVITDNVFSTSAACQTIRFVHVQSNQNTDFSITVTRNKFTGVANLNQTGLEVYYPTNPEKVVLNHNYMDAPMSVCIGTGGTSYNNAWEKAYPFVAEDLQSEIRPVAMGLDSAGNNRLFLTLEDAAKDGYVAMTGGRCYKTLAEAVAAAKDGNTVALLKNISESNIWLKDGVTLDLGGYSIDAGSKGNKYGLLADKGITATVKNGVIKNAYSGLTVWGTENKDKPTTVTVDKDVTIQDTQYGIIFTGYSSEHNFVGKTGYAVLNFNGTINGSCIFVMGNLGNDEASANSIGEDGNLINIGATAKINAAGDNAVTLNGMAKLNVVDGAVLTGDDAITMKRGYLNITGGTFTGTGKKHTPTTAEGSGAESSGSAITVSSTYNYAGKIDVKISGGTFNSVNSYGFYAGQSVKDGQQIEFKNTAFEISGGNFSGDNGAVYFATGKHITGGLFSSDPSAYVAAGHYVDASNNGDYPYTVKEGTKPAGALIVVKDKTEPTVSGDITGDNKTAIDKVIGKANVDGVTEAAKKADIVTESGVTVAENDKVEIEVAVKVEAKAADLANGKLTFEASPVAAVTVTKANGNTETKSDVKVSNSMLNNNPITVKLPLPTVDGKLFTPKQILHKFTGGGYEYFINATEGSKRGAQQFTVENGCAVFTIYGFSTFELSGTVTYVEPSSGGGSSSSSRRYDVSAPSVKHGDVTVSPKSASKGDTVTITVKPDSGYELDTLTVKDASGSKIKVKDKGNGKFTFSMPASKVTVSAEFAEIETLDFADVSTDAYYYEAVKWAAKKGITGGTGDGNFNPNGSCTRAHIVTFLWRAAGSPEPKSTVSFADVPAGSYYAKAVAWAVENGITLGTGDGTFSPNATCTRAQSVTFLYRALGTAPTTVNGFTDVTADAFYADAVAWAVESGVTNGTSASTFSPNNGCTRAQIVTFLFRAYQGK